MPHKYYYKVVASKQISTTFQVKANSLDKAEALAKEITHNGYVELQFPSKDLDYTVDTIKQMDFIEPYYVVTKYGNYFQVQNFHIDLAAAECYGCPTEEAMFAILKIIFKMERDDCMGSEFRLEQHDTNKYQWDGQLGEGEVFETSCIEQWLKDFEY
jgi:hypothetical protein